jgi:hypothetical protein
LAGTDAGKGANIFSLLSSLMACLVVHAQKHNGINKTVFRT